MTPVAMSSTTEMEQCIQNCQECYRVCAQMMGHCLEKGGPHADPAHLLLMADCAKICAVSADFMIRSSARHQLICGVCAPICEACAEDCDRLADDPAMRRCADICRRCAASCKAMASA